MGGVAGLPEVRPQADYGQTPGVGVANLPGGAVVHLGAVEDGDHVCGGVDRVPATLENMVLGGRAEAGKVDIVKEVPRPRHGRAGQLAQAVAQG